MKTKNRIKVPCSNSFDGSGVSMYSGHATSAPVITARAFIAPEQLLSYRFYSVFRDDEIKVKDVTSCIMRYGIFWML